MAKRSKVVANARRKRTVARYAERRAALKEAVRNATTVEERDAAVRSLSRLPRDAGTPTGPGSVTGPRLHAAAAVSP